MANFFHALTSEIQILARACGKSDVHHLEPEDLRALTPRSLDDHRVAAGGDESRVWRRAGGGRISRGSTNDSERENIHVSRRLGRHPDCPVLLLEPRDGHARCRGGRCVARGFAGAILAGAILVAVSFGLPVYLAPKSNREMTAAGLVLLGCSGPSCFAITPG